MSDYIVRATAADLQIRAFAATTKELVEFARASHNTSPVVTAALGRLLTAGAMMGSMMKGENDKLTIQILCFGPVKGLTVTADSKGNVKGFAKVPQAMMPPSAVGKLDVGGLLGEGFLRVIKDMGLKEPYNSTVKLQTGEIGDDLTYYFQESEQVASGVGVGVLMNRDNTVKQAGGFIIQLMPFATDEIIDKLAANLAKITSVTTLFEDGNTPEQILEIILEGMNPVITDTMPTQFVCNCSKDKVESALISLGKEELTNIVNDGKEEEVNCQFCNKSYVFQPADLKALLKKAQSK